MCITTAGQRVGRVCAAGRAGWGIRPRVVCCARRARGRRRLCHRSRRGGAGRRAQSISGAATWLARTVRLAGPDGATGRRPAAGVAWRPAQHRSPTAHPATPPRLPPVLILTARAHGLGRAVHTHALSVTAPLAPRGPQNSPARSRRGPTRSAVQPSPVPSRLRAVGGRQQPVPSARCQQSRAACVRRWSETHRRPGHSAASSCTRVNIQHLSRGGGG